MTQKTKPVKIMLVEDDEFMVQLLTTLLEMEGYDICKFSDGDEFFEVLSQELPDIVFMDVYLEKFSQEDINGLTLLDQIRGRPEFEHTKIIMSSGINFKSESKKQGADGFLQKPYLPDNLISLLEEVLL